MHHHHQVVVITAPDAPPPPVQQQCPSISGQTAIPIIHSVILLPHPKSSISVLLDSQFCLSTNTHSNISSFVLRPYQRSKNGTSIRTLFQAVSPVSNVKRCGPTFQDLPFRLSLGWMTCPARSLTVCHLFVRVVEFLQSSSSRHK